MKRSFQNYKLLVFVLLILTGHLVQSQKAKLKKANEEFDQYAFIDARKIYLKVAESGYESPQLYKKLGDTYYFNGEYEEAVKWYGPLVTKYPTNLEADYYYRAAQTYKSIGEYHTSKKMMGQYASLSANSGIAQNFMKSYPVLDSLVGFQSKRFNVENITNTQNSSDFGPSFNGSKIIYASSSGKSKGSKTHNWNGLPYLDLFEAEVDEDFKLSKPTPLRGNINSPYHESSAIVTQDGSTMYFTRNNYINGKRKRNKKKEVTLKIYQAKKNNNGFWDDILELPFNNDSYSVAHPSLNSDESRLYFSSNMPGTIGESDIWYVEVTNHQTFGSPINLGPQINTEARETFPFISKTNNLYFSSDGHLGLGGLDIFVVSLNEEGEFVEVTNLKQPVNTNKDDFGFIIDEEKQIGFLSSNRDSNKGHISDDIYRIWEKCNGIYINGQVTDAKTGNPIQGSRVTLLDENNEMVLEVESDIEGQYRFEEALDCAKRYSVRGENDDEEYNPLEKTITTPRGSHVLEVDLALVPPDCDVDDLGCRLNLQPIYFDYGKYTIRKNAEVELAKILEAMKEYPQLEIHIESHTDSRSSYNFNMNLSKKRAWTTMHWFINNGIDPNRLTYKGYGETQLLNNCSSGVNCSDEEHQLNRRSMFIMKN